MTFDEWHQKQLDGDTDNCPHEAWERTAWDAAILAEREACAKECEEFISEVQSRFANAAFGQCATAIRMRSNA